MDCAQTRTYFECYADGELDPITSAGVEEHLDHCATCQRAVDRLNSLRALIKQGALYRTAPDSLSHEVRARLDRQAQGGRRERATPQVIHPLLWQWLKPIALVAGTAVVTWIAASQLNQPSHHELIAEEVIATHVRSTLTGHLADVASSERHTVKPWLSSKLDFSPPVTDLTDAGFPLAGGRLDYVDHRSVAVLVYRRRQHVINLFIWPENDARPVSTPHALSKRGYHALNWTHSGMTFWAISDLNAGELKLFSENFSSSK
jgi:anti-sigma factor RsiW